MVEGRIVRKDADEANRTSISRAPTKILEKQSAGGKLKKYKQNAVYAREEEKKEQKKYC